MARSEVALACDILAVGGRYLANQILSPAISTVAQIGLAWPAEASGCRPDKPHLTSPSCGIVQYTHTHHTSWEHVHRRIEAKQNHRLASNSSSPRNVPYTTLVRLASDSRRRETSSLSTVDMCSQPRSRPPLAGHWIPIVWKRHTASSDSSLFDVELRDIAETASSLSLACNSPPTDQSCPLCRGDTMQTPLLTDKLSDNSSSPLACLTCLPRLPLLPLLPVRRRTS